MKNLFWTRKGVGGSIKRDKGGRESFIKWDMMGRRMVIILSVVPFLAGNILIGLSSNLWQVLLSRCLVGLGDGMMYPNMLGKLIYMINSKADHCKNFSLCSRDSQ